jgi:hypothetical protein
LADITKEPSVEMVVIRIAFPLLTGTEAPPGIVTPLLVKVTVPEVTGFPPLVTVAVKVTEELAPLVKEGLLFEEMVVVVEGGRI